MDKDYQQLDVNYQTLPEELKKKISKNMFKEKVYPKIKQFLNLERKMGTFNARIIGEEHINSLSIKKKKKKGQFYTPELITNLICELTIFNSNINKKDDKNEVLVLDPCCGTGYFLHSVMDKYLRESEGIKNKNNDLKNNVLPANKLDNIKLNLIGIDINPISAALAYYTLELRRKITKSSNKFEIKKKIQTRILPEDYFSNQIDTTIPKKSVDYIISNPPYVRQREIKDKKWIRGHLSDFESKIQLSKRSDLYVYFFSRSFKLLKEDGRIGFVIPSKWMNTNYGTDLQHFFLEFFIVETIIQFSERVFDNILVPVCIVILRKSSNNKLKKKSKTVFLTLHKKRSIKEILKILNNEDIDNHPNIRLISYNRLKKEDKWMKFILAPPLYWKLINFNNFVPLEKIVNIKYLIKTGCDEFFYISSKIIKEFGIEKELIKPLARSISQTITICFKEIGEKYYVLYLSKFVKKYEKDLETIDKLNFDKIENFGKKINEEKDKVITFKEYFIKKIMKEIDDEDAKIRYLQNNLLEFTPKEIFLLYKLKSEEYTGIFNYIVKSLSNKEKWGRYGPPHNRTSCQTHQKKNHAFFNLGHLRAPDIMVPETIDKRTFSVINEEKHIADVDLIDVNFTSKLLQNMNINKEIEKLMQDFVKAYLNSTYFSFFREIEGRTSGGKASRLKIFELKKIKILDPTKIPQKILLSISNIFNTMNMLPINSKNYNLKRRLVDEKISEAIILVEKINNEEIKGLTDELYSEYTMIFQNRIK